jgi:uncharacterized protein involved in exopolysaccharide biosynthesis
VPVTSIFEPDNPNELLRGWLLHAHKGRDRHDLAAKRCDQQRYLLGIPATIISAIVGTSIFAALQQTSSSALTQIIIGSLAIIAAILASLQSFLDLGARAERHRIAGAKYKATIRRLEQLGIGTISGMRLDDPMLTEVRQSLDALEEEMPVVPPSIYDLVEAKYRDKVFVDSVLAQARSKSHPK